jgi:hypothetical protein
MSLLSVASKAAGAAASSSSSSKSSLASAGSSVGKGVSGVTVSSTIKLTSTTKSSGPTGVAAIANAFDTNGGKSSSPAVIKTISAAGKAAAAAAGKATVVKASSLDLAKPFKIAPPMNEGGPSWSRAASLAEKATDRELGGLLGLAIFGGLVGIGAGVLKNSEADDSAKTEGQKETAPTGDGKATSGDIKRPADIPDTWIEKPAKKGGGVKWVNPDNPLHDYVRGKADGTYTQVRDGKAYDAGGNKVDTDSAAAHGISLGDFVFRPGKKK